MQQIDERDQRQYDAADSAFTSEGGFLGATVLGASSSLGGASATTWAAAEARERIMAEAAVVYDGRYYYHAGHRYGGLVDAVDQSLLMRSQPEREHPLGPFTMTPAIYARTDDAQLMASLGITLVAGVYCFETYRYDHLEDAVGYARLLRTRGMP